MNDYNLKGLRISKKKLDNSKFEFIKYKGFLVRFVIAKDDMGIQICEDGAFFFLNNQFSFESMDDAYTCLKYHREDAIKFFRKVYLNEFKYLLSWPHVKHLYWKVIHYFNPNFYLS